MNHISVSELPWTGERIVPDTPGEEWLFQYHWTRYSFAASIIEGGRVLDLGTGAGYGAHLLARSNPKSHVTGVDVSPDAVAFARQKYQAPNLQYTVGDARFLPFPPASFNYIVCYEVLEHLEDTQTLLSSARGLLRPGGLLIVSTPNREVYSKGQDKPWNPYHIKEYSPQEFEQLVGGYFSHVEIYNQAHAVGSLISKGETLSTLDVRTDLLEQRKHRGPTFMIALCSSAPPPSQPSRLWLMEVQSLDETLEMRRRYTEKLKGTIDWLVKTKRELQAYKEETERLLVVRKWRCIEEIYTRIVNRLSKGEENASS